METGAHKSGGGGAAGEHLPRAYPNAHPSAKQRRAHRKNCGNPPSPAAAVVEEGDGKKLLQDDGAPRGEGDGASASAADSGGVSPGSAQEVGNVVDDEGNAERSSPHGSEVQAVLSKCAEDCVVSDNCIPSGNDFKASGTENDDIQAEVVMRHSEAPGIAKPQQQADSARLTPNQLIIPKEIDIDERLHCPDADGDANALSSAVEHADEDVSAVNHTKNMCSPHFTAEDDIQDNVRQTSDITLMPSQVDLSEVSTSSTSHEIDKVISKDGTDERSPNVNLTSHEVHGIDVEEILQNEDITAYNDPQESNTVCGTCDFEENTQSEEIIAEASSHKITTVQSTCNVEEKEQIEEIDSNAACNKINEISSRVVEETKQSDVFVETADEISVAGSLENVEEEQRNKQTVADPSLEINVVNLPSSLELSKLDVETTTDHTAYEANTVKVTEIVEESKLNEDPTSDINMICSTATDEKKQNEDMSDGTSSDEIVVPHDKFNVEEKNEETMPGPTSDKINVVGTTDSVEVKNQNREVTSGTTSHEDSAICIHTTDNVEEKKGEELTSDPTSYKLDVESVGAVLAATTESNADNVEDKGQTEGIDVPQSADDAEERKQEETVSTVDLMGDNQTESDTLQITDDAGNKKQHAEVAAEPPSDKTDVPQSTDDAEEMKQEETVATDDNPKGNDQNEEIADKEVIVSSDKNHISLKSLLSEKVVETKEKKPSTKDRVLSFRRRASKDGASPVKPGSPKAAVSGQQDWNSPARLPVEKKPKGKKQQWVPFICCPSMN
ncbi:hypothetical protein E2562_001810 [Oryza meyeriana var. granulata]|uniref:Uncharacterized protein n=1 Tax=Oryza meyeriana var. granulata TaxID=110450 RepID=A0A6G1CEX5_9ORYZ|nr:hypothetical protein E2562_001810 [Oryza meyeriana var. granulata]